MPNRLALLSLIALAGCRNPADPAAQTDATLTPPSGLDVPALDRDGPEIEVLSPQRAAWLAAGEVLVTGTVSDESGLRWLLINDHEVEVGPDGSFSSPVALAEGMNTLRIEAQDRAGNASDDVRSVMAGDFLAAGELLRDAAQLRLGSEELAEAAGAVEEKLAARPLLPSGSTPLLAGGGCVALEGAINRVRFEDSEATVTPSAEGVVIEVAFSKLQVAAQGDADACGNARTFQAKLTDSEARLVVAGSLESPSPGKISFVPSSSELILTAPVVTGRFSKLLQGTDVKPGELGLAPAFAEALAPVLADLSGNAVAAELVALAEAELAVSAPVDVDLHIAAVSADDVGVTVVFDSIVEFDGRDDAIPPNPGSLVLSGESPVYPEDVGVQASLSLSAMNRAAHMVWESGAMHQHVTATDLGLAELVSAAYPEAEEITVFFHPQLPPVLQAGTGGASFDLAMGELFVEVRGIIDGEDTSLALASMHVWADVALVSGASEVSADVSIDDVFVDVILMQSGVSVEGIVDAAVEDLIYSAVNDALPVLSVPQPVVGWELAAYPDGLDGTWLTVGVVQE